MSTIDDRPNRLPWPPMIYVSAAALALVLDWLAPLPWIPGPFGEFLFAVGWLAVAGALAIDFAAMRAMRRARTTIMPNRGSDHLVTGGPFSFTLIRLPPPSPRERGEGDFDSRFRQSQQAWQKQHEACGSVPSPRSRGEGGPKGRMRGGASGRSSAPARERRFRC